MDSAHARPVDPAPATRRRALGGRKVGPDDLRLIVGLTLLAIGLALSPCQGATLLDVPLKPWTYFDPNRDWTYAAIEKLVTAGIVGPWVLNTKPMSRMEMARIVSLAIRKIREDESGRFMQRTDLEPVLYELMEELAPELEVMGVRQGEGELVGQPLLSLQPLYRVQASGFWASNADNPPNSQGLRLAEGFGGTFGFSSYFQLGDYLSGYINPQFQYDGQEANGEINEGYLKLKLGNLAVLAGRESLWWGPGQHGAMMFSNNAPPLNQIRIGTAEPIVLPWIFRYLGPTKMDLMYARLESNRDHPHAMLGAWRFGMAPLEFLELGVSRVVQFGGDGRPSLSPIDYILALFVSSDSAGSKFQTNQLYTLDATLRLHDVERVFPLTRDLTIYAEMGVDDTCCKNIVWPLKPAYLVGAYFPNVLGSNNTEFRVEWAQTTSFSFTHSIYTNGISYEGFPIAHFIGSRGQDLYFRTAERILPNLQLGLDFGYAKVGSTNISEVDLPREERRYAGVDISYRPIPPLSLLLGYRYEKRKNVGFISGNNLTNHVVRLEATYSFEPWEKGMLGRLRRDEALRPPPAPPVLEPDPDQVFSLRYVRRVAEDTGTILTSPLRWDLQDWLIFGGVGLATGGLMFLDTDINDALRRNQSSTLDTVSSVIGAFGTWVPAALMGGMYIAGNVYDVPSLKAASADALEASLIATGLIAVPLNFIIGRSRPEDNRGSTSYNPFTAGSSLPSLTTTFVFSVASVMAEHADNLAISLLSYGIATAVGLSRMYDDKHWASDVLLGAAIGTAVGKLVVKLNDQRRADSRVSVVPLASDKMQGAMLQVKF